MKLEYDVTKIATFGRTGTRYIGEHTWSLFELRKLVFSLEKHVYIPAVILSCICTYDDV